MSEPLPALLDPTQLRMELGVTRAAAEAIIRKVPTVQIPGFKKTYVEREDVRRFLDSCTSEGEWHFRKTSIPA